MFTLKDSFLMINPQSGKKNIQGLIEEVQQHFQELAYTITKNKEDADQVLKENLEKYKVFIIAGGDGTVNQAIPHFVGRKDKVFCVFPTGSGNGFAKEMGFQNNLVNLIKAIQIGKTKEIDLIQCNDRYAVNVAGIGVEGYISELFLRQKKRGIVKYIYLTIKTLLDFIPFRAQIKAGHFQTDGKYMGITIANTRQFGNHAYIAPRANPSDGKLDLVLTKDMPFYQYFSFFIKLFTKKISDSKYITYLQTNEKIMIFCDFPYAHVDGEPFRCSGSLEVKINPKAVRLIVSKLD